MELHALRTRGWSISAIARHLGRDRKTIRDYLAGKRELGVRRRPGPDVFEQYQAYVQVRLTDDPHVWATALYDEVRKLGYDLSYPSFVREIRSRRLRPHCEACAGVSGRPTIEIDHPLGEEIQWDWLKLPAPWGGDAHLLNGTLAHSTKARGVFAESEDQAHLVEAIDAVVRRLGGNARCWRFDRMGTVVDIGTDHVLPSFAAVAKYYGVSLAICPSRHGNRKGMVEKQNHYSTQRWWRCRGGGAKPNPNTHDRLWGCDWRGDCLRCCGSADPGSRRRRWRSTPPPRSKRTEANDRQEDSNWQVTVDATVDRQAQPQIDKDSCEHDPDQRQPQEPRRVLDHEHLDQRHSTLKFEDPR